MLVACRLAGLSALDTYYAGVNADAQSAEARRVILWTDEDRLLRRGRWVVSQLSICWPRTVSNISICDA
jgi:hypothetical protein